jgi:hypothetical protein
MPVSRSKTNLDWDMRIKLVIAYLVLSVAEGVLSPVFYPGQVFSPITVAFMLAYLFLVFWWYRVDSDVQKYSRSVWLNVGVICLNIIALPYYFFRTRGGKGGAIATIVFLLFIVASGFLTGIVEWGTYTVLQDQQVG